MGGREWLAEPCRALRAPAVAALMLMLRSATVRSLRIPLGGRGIVRLESEERRAEYKELLLTRVLDVDGEFGEVDRTLGLGDIGGRPVSRVRVFGRLSAECVAESLVGGGEMACGGCCPAETGVAGARGQSGAC